MSLNFGPPNNGYNVTGGNKKGWKREDCRNFPVISIITSTYNAVKYLPMTMKSIRDQSYKNIQWIIADGGSDDGTIDVLKENEDIVDYWFSGKDNGIYDAWNKAIPYVQGEWVQFLGAGDVLENRDSIMQMSVYLSRAFPDHELVFGNSEFISEKKRTIIERKARTWEEMKGKWVFFRPELPDHAAVFHHRSIFTNSNSFDMSYRIAGDTHLLLRSILKKEPAYFDVNVCSILIGGVSSTIGNYYRMYGEVTRINKELGIILPIMHWSITMAKLIIKLFLVKFLPQKTANKLMDFFRQVQGLKKKWTIT